MKQQLGSVLCFIDVKLALVHLSFALHFTISYRGSKQRFLATLLAYDCDLIYYNSIEDRYFSDYRRSHDEVFQTTSLFSKKNRLSFIIVTRIKPIISNHRFTILC